LIGLLTGILVARFLGPEGRGELATVIVWVSMLAYVGNLGLPAAYTYAAAQEPSRARQLLSNGVLAVLVQWLALILLGLLVLNLALAGHPDQTLHLAALYLCLYVPLNLLTLYANAVQQGLGQYAGFNAVRLCVPVSYLVGLGVLVVADRMTVGSVLAANLFSNLATLALALALVLPSTRYQREGHRFFDLAALRRDARYGLSAHLGTLQPFNGLRIDVLLLTVLLTAHDLGLYMAALAGASLIRAQGFALGMVVMPEAAKRLDRRTQRKVIARFAAFALLLGGCTAAVAFVWAKPLIELIYGDAFSGAASALRLLVLGAVTASLQRVLADGLRGMGRPFSGTAAELASLAVGVPAILLLAPSGGVNGAAIAVGMASVGALVVTAWALIRARSLPGESIVPSTTSASGQPVVPDKAS
jgi:O-antigen/teichoic acid export membrane protein